MDTIFLELHQRVFTMFYLTWRLNYQDRVRKTPGMLHLAPAL